MIYNEVNRNLFDVDEDYYFVQCISADLKIGKGIALEFNRRFDVRNNLLMYYGPKGLSPKSEDELYCTCLRENVPVYNLVTKRKYYEKPTYQSLYRALVDLRNNEPYKLAMPLIACGFDNLYWIKVREIIKYVFAETDVEILVCYTDNNKSLLPARELSEIERINLIKSLEDK